MRYLAASLLILLGLVPASGQVTTATLYGVVRDSTGAVIPDAMVTATHQGTGQTRNGTSDMSGEFALAALPPGPYTLRIQAPGFRTYINEGISLVGGQVTRQTFNMEVGEVTESITVADTVPLLETAQVAQQETLGTREVEELPLARRNLVSLMTLAPGVAEASTGIAGGGNIRLNGVSEGGTLITIDGTDAVGNLETRGANSYGAQNQISVMSIEAVAEVQVVKGILPAEYGSVTGGQVNMISRSGTNSFHGSVFENWQNDVLFARDPFLPLTQKKPDVRFNQFGGSLGGPIVPNRAFFFGAYEGYRETFGVTQQGQVPTQAFRDRILAALPMPETSIVLDTMPLPNEAINANVGLFRDARPRERRDDTFLTKGDVLIGGGNLSVTYSRMRPFTVNPTIYINPGNDQEFDTKQDRVAAQYTLAGPTWVSETRWGYNRNQLDRVNQFWNVVEPGASLPGNETVVGRRIPQMVVQGLFSTPSSEILQLKGRTYTFEQKFSRILGQHNIKAGFRYARVAGSKTNPQNPIISFQNEADLLANVPNGATLEFGIPPHDGNLDEWGGFIQDDWRITPRFVLNMGLRYDYYPTFQVRPTTSRPAEIVNLEAPSNINLLDFGAPRPVDNPYNSDANNFGPRLGFAWTVDEGGTTVVRGGVGVLFSPMMFATIQNTVTDPYVPASLSLNRADVADFGLQWPTYMDDAEAQVRAMAGNEKTLFSLIDPGIRNPYTVQSMLSVQRSFGGSWVVEAGYLRTDGQNFPLHRFFAQAFDRVTGDRPNPALGTPGGYYITGDQTMVYNALQTSLRKQFASGLSFDVHYTLSRGRADQGGGLSSAFVNSDIVATQDFFDPFFDRTEVSQNPLHRVAANVIYELPWLRDAGGFTGALLGGWRVSSIVNARTGRPRVITQPSGIPRSRPDRVGTAVLDDYRETLQYFDRAAFVPVPTSPVSGATLRPGNANAADVRDPGFWQVDMSAGKNFRFTERVGLEVRLDAFNAFNHVNFNPPNGNINSPIFGRLTSVVGMRTAQIAARLAF